MRKRFSLVALFAAFALIVSACGGSDAEEATTSIGPTTTTEARMSVLDLAAEAGEFSTLLTAIDAAGLTGTLEGEGPFTVFAPTDAAFQAAFDALGIDAATLLGDTELLTSILTYHVIGGQAADSQLVATLDGQQVPTVNGQSVTISVDGGSIMIDGAAVVAADLRADNGIVHVIDSVLLPPDVAEALGVGGDTTTTTEATTTTTTTMPEAAPTIAEIVVDFAGGDPAEFSILLAAVQAADPSVLALLSDPEAEVTVFAPTDEAFGAALEALGLTADDLLASTELLTSILLYHVVDGPVPAEAVLTLDGFNVSTLNEGNSVSVSIVDGGVVLNDGVDPLGGSNVIQTDVLAGNGIIHVIDAVLINEAILGGPMAAPTIAEIVVDFAGGDPAEFSILLAAVQAADPSVLALLSDPEAEVTVFAPTDEAFGAALEALGLTADDLLASTELLTSILLYHVVDGAVFAETVVTLDGMDVETLNTGNSVAVSIIDGGVVLNDGVAPLGGSNVIQTDVEAANGVVHVIDAVLINEAILGG